MAYREEELDRLRLNFYGFDPSYHIARYYFVRVLLCNANSIKAGIDHPNVPTLSPYIHKALPLRSRNSQHIPIGAKYYIIFSCQFNGQAL